MFFSECVYICEDTCGFTTQELAYTLCNTLIYMHTDPTCIAYIITYTHHVHTQHTHALIYTPHTHYIITHTYTLHIQSDTDAYYRYT